MIVTAVNDAPVAQAQAVAAIEDQQVAITLAGSDIEATRSPTPSSARRPVARSPVPEPRARISRPANLNGPDSFTFTVSDGTATSAPATVTINVAPVEACAVRYCAVDHRHRGYLAPIVLTGSDPDGDALTFALATGPAHGTLSGTPPDLTYTPAPTTTAPTH